MTAADFRRIALGFEGAEEGSHMGAVDFRVTPEGEHVFLEVNPAGQFLFIENATGMKIADTLAGHLASARR